MDSELRFLTGAGSAIVIAAIARRAGSLTTGGAIAAALVGTAAVAAGWSWGFLLILYFVSSTLLSRVGRRTKLERTAGMVEKPGARDGRQVLSNGVVFAALAGSAAYSSDLDAFVMGPAAAALAASAADTWATEIGTLVGQAPRSILTGRRLAIGQSGGVTWAGTLASLAGAGFIAAISFALGWPRSAFVPVVAGGIVGSITDSVLGALAQERRWCDACGKGTEMRVHSCGTRTRRVGGLPFMNNDLVNLLATLAGALTASLLMAPR